MNEAPTIESRKNKGCLRILGIILITIIISIAATFFAVTHYLFPKQLNPVALSQNEEVALNKKLQKLGLPTLSNEKFESKPKPLRPEPYSEKNTKREAGFSEKELNAILARNTDLADKMAIDLSDNLVSIKMIIPLDPNFPFLGGKTLKVNAGAKLAYANERPIVVLKGISIWGIPIPNAWLGNLKNIDLVGEFGGNAGFWKTFADGVENIHVEEENLKIKFKR